MPIQLQCQFYQKAFLGYHDVIFYIHKMPNSDSFQEGNKASQFIIDYKVYQQTININFI